jgi:hypothetical protein
MTETIVKTVKVNKADRFIADQHTVGNYRVTIRTSYYQKAKCYITRVKESRLEFHDNWVTEISQLNIGLSEQRPEDDYNEKIQTVKVNRYNFQDLQKYHALAVAEADDSLIVTELLLKGKTNSEIYGKGN